MSDKKVSTFMQLASQAEFVDEDDRKTFIYTAEGWLCIAEHNHMPWMSLLFKGSYDEEKPALVQLAETTQDKVAWVNLGDLQAIKTLRECCDRVITEYDAYCKAQEKAVLR